MLKTANKQPSQDLPVIIDPNTLPKEQIHNEIKLKILGKYHQWKEEMLLFRMIWSSMS